jgi:DNA-binding IclR family transcriptional regulator
MTELVASTGESVDFAIRDGDSAVFIDKIDGTQEVRAFTRAGQRPTPRDRGRKVFLAAMGRPSWPRTRGPCSPTRRRPSPTLVSRDRRTRPTPGLGDQSRRAIRRQGRCRPRARRPAAASPPLGLNVPLSRLTDDRVQVLVADLQARTARLPTIGRQAT